MTNPQYELHVYGEIAGTGLEDSITLNGTGESQTNIRI